MIEIRAFCVAIAMLAIGFLIVPWVIPVISVYFEFVDRRVHALMFGNCDAPLVYYEHRCWNYPEKK